MVFTRAHASVISDTFDFTVPRSLFDLAVVNPPRGLYAPKSLVSWCKRRNALRMNDRRWVQLYHLFP
jgi:hypothetical protein